MYALPGRVLDAFSEGTNHLIQMGAMCVTRPKDILLDLWGEERLNMDDVSGAASGSAENKVKCGITLQPQNGPYMTF